MAESKARIPEDDFVSKVVKDPKQPPDTLLLSGFLGKSSEEGHTRLYFDPELRNYVEIPQDAILHWQEMSKESSPLGGSHVWINPQAELIHGKVGPQRTKARFFEGPIAAGAGGVANAVTGFVCPPTAPALCPVTIGCPTLPPLQCPHTPLHGCPTPPLHCPPSPPPVFCPHTPLHGCPTPPLHCPPPPTPLCTHFLACHTQQIACQPTILPQLCHTQPLHCPTNVVPCPTVGGCQSVQVPCISNIECPSQIGCPSPGCGPIGGPGDPAGHVMQAQVMQAQASAFCPSHPNICQFTPAIVCHPTPLCPPNTAPPHCHFTPGCPIASANCPQTPLCPFPTQLIHCHFTPACPIVSAFCPTRFACPSAQIPCQTFPACPSALGCPSGPACGGGPFGGGAGPGDPAAHAMRAQAVTVLPACPSLLGCPTSPVCGWPQF
jgi:hypothetical protein